MSSSKTTAPPTSSIAAATPLAPVASNAPAAVVAKPKSRKRKAIDPALDFFSASFDPLKALMTPGLKPPVPDAKPLPSLLMCKQLLEVNIDQPNKSDQRTDKSTKNKVAEEAIPNPLAPYTSQFKLPQLLGDKRERISGRAAAIASMQSNVIPATQTINQSNNQTINPSPKPSTVESAGPMSQLRRWFEARCRVVVTTRSQRSLRSSVSGMIVAFDKHWNMLLIDCDEQYSLISSQSVSERQRTSTMDATGRTKRRWHWVKCDRLINVPMQRHVGQMLIKGDTIVSVVKHEPQVSDVFRSTLIERV